MTYIRNATILVIDDEDDNLFIMTEYLELECKKILLENRPEKVMALAERQQPDIILLDICMPEMDGYEVCRHLKTNPQTQAIPVIFLSSLMRASDKVKGFKVGAVDYISKPFEIEEVIARIESCLNIHQQLRQNQLKIDAEFIEKTQKYDLNTREIKILRLYIKGYQRSKIAANFSVSDNTIKWYLKIIFSKLDATNRAEVIEKSHEIGL